MKILTTICDEHLTLIKEELKGHEVKCVKNADEDFVKNADILLFFYWRDAKRVIPMMKNVKMIQAMSAGVDYINFDIIPKDAIVCSNAGANATGVAEHAVALLLASLKRIPYRDRKMREGEFPQMLESRLLRGKKIGIVGFGNIGQRIARMLSCFGVKIYAINRSGKYEGDINVVLVGTIDDLDAILPQMDIVILSLPLTRETYGLFNRERLNLMKKDAILVNVARGKIIVEKDLYDFLKDNRSFTAAIDTWWHYGDEFRQNYPFENLDNIILSPHCGGIYEGWIEDEIKYAVENIKRFLRGEKPKNIVDEKMQFR